MEYSIIIYHKQYYNKQQNQIHVHFIAEKKSILTRKIIYHSETDL